MPFPQRDKALVIYSGITPHAEKIASKTSISKYFNIDSNEV